MAALPEPAQVRQAIDIYLQTAYAGNPPAKVAKQMQALDASPDEPLKCSVFAHDANASDTKYFLRLGNLFYPHMKLAVELPPNGEYFLYRVDTHDRHCCPAPGAREYDEFCRLMENNQKLADQIESAWEVAGLPTFKTFLREDIKRRQAAANTQ